jgi:hypothetical protein
MYSGFVTQTKVIKRAGIHQRFDMAAYRMIKPYLPAGFPTLKDIIHFEGYNGPDGLKVKNPNEAELSHLYDPATDTGEVPMHVANHYQRMVECLKVGDPIRAAFEASWMAHFIGDGLTPAHHWPLEAKLYEAREAALDPALDTKDFARLMAHAKKHWVLWGSKGHYSTHFNFEMGVAFALIIVPIRATFDEAMLAHARKLGPIEFFKEQAREVATLNLYQRFYREGWNNEIATIIKNQVAPVTAATIGYIWLLAILEAGQELAMGSKST